MNIIIRRRSHLLMHKTGNNNDSTLILASHVDLIAAFGHKKSTGEQVDVQFVFYP